MILVLIHIDEHFINPKTLAPTETGSNLGPSEPVQIYFSCLLRPFSSYMI